MGAPLYAPRLQALPAPANPRIENERRYDDARIEVARYQRERYALILRLGRGNTEGITTARIDQVNARLRQALAQQAAIEGVVLDASVGLDMNLPEENDTAMHEALERLIPPADADVNDEHRLTSSGYGIQARAR